jgi:hypothetical protein
MPRDPSTKVTRNHKHLRVPVNPEEEVEIKRLATAANKAVADYLRSVGLGYEVRGILDHRRVEELLRINGDLGRLGGLLKLWLTNDERTVAFGDSTIRALLAKIEATQDEMQTVVRMVVIPRAER